MLSHKHGGELHIWNAAAEGCELSRRDRLGIMDGCAVLCVKEGMDCEKLPLSNSHKQLGSWWVKIKGRNLLQVSAPR